MYIYLYPKKKVNNAGR